MEIYVDESRTGAGKTEKAIERMIASSCKTIFAMERIESFDEVEQRIREMAGINGIPQQIRKIHGCLPNRGGSVSEEVEALATDPTISQQAIVLITHAALLQSDFSDFQDWQIVVDEVPRFLDFQEKQTSLDRAFFIDHYQLTKETQGWSSVTVSHQGRSVSRADLLADESHAHLSVFHDRVLKASQPHANRMVLCNLKAWTEMQERKLKWSWASIYPISELSSFKRIEFLGSGFQRDVGCILTKFTKENVEWITLPELSTQRSFRHREVQIQYFSETRQASRSLFESVDGQKMLLDIGHHLSLVTDKSKLIWTANERHVKPALSEIVGKELKPKQAGTNEYQTMDQAVVIYAAKPCANLRSFLAAFEVNEDHWTRSVEYETILQFVTRTSIRDPNSCSKVHIWVFDIWQAKHLECYFREMPHLSVTLRKEDFDFEIPSKKKSGPKPVILTPPQRAAKDAERRVRDAQRKRRERSKKKST